MIEALGSITITLALVAAVLGISFWWVSRDE